MPAHYAPCVVNDGIVYHQPDMVRLLSDLGYVQYHDIVDGSLRCAGQGYVMEVFADPACATLVANRSLYLNLCSFDYLRLSTDLEQQTIYELVQESRILRLMPLSSPEITCDSELRALEAAVADALAWDGWED